MLQAIKDLFGSKKFLVFLAGVVTYIAGKFGFDVDQTVLNNLIEGVGFYLLGQGIADHGKEAAKIVAASVANDSALPTDRGQLKQSGFASVVVMLFIAIAGFALLWSSGCGPKVLAAEHQFLTCAESAVAHDLTPTVEAILAEGASTWKAQLTAFGVAFGTDAINCAVLAAKTMFSTKVGLAPAGSALARADEWLKEHGGG